MGCPAGSESVSAALGDVFLMGGRACAVCSAESASAITKEIADGTMSFTEISLRFNVSRNSVARHSKNCLHIRRIEKEAAAPVERTEAIRSSRIDPHDPQALLAAQAQLVNQALDVAEHAVDHRTQLAAIREARDGLTVLMRTAGMLQADGGVVIDARRQTLVANVGELSVEELRALAAGRANVTENF